MGKDNSNLMGIIALILGLIGLFIAGLILGILAIIFGIIGRGRDRKPVYATVGVVLGVIDVLFVIIGMII